MGKKLDRFLKASMPLWTFLVYAMVLLTIGVAFFVVDKVLGPVPGFGVKVGLVETQTPTPTFTPTSTATPTPTFTPSPTPTFTPTPAPTPTPTPDPRWPWCVGCSTKVQAQPQSNPQVKWEEFYASNGGFAIVPMITGKVTRIEIGDFLVDLKKNGEVITSRWYGVVLIETEGVYLYELLVHSTEFPILLVDPGETVGPGTPVFEFKGPATVACYYLPKGGDYRDWKPCEEGK